VPVNEQRGEVAITLAGKSFVLRPTYGALAEIESTLGCGIVALVRRLERGDFGVVDLAVIVTAGLKAAGEPATQDKVGEMIRQAGFAPVVKATAAFLENALTGGQEPGKNQAAGADRS